MASSSVTRGSTVTLTGFPLIVSVIGAGPGPATLAGAGAATASRSSRPVPTAPPPRLTPRMNPRRENLAFGLAGDWGSFLELTRYPPFWAFAMLIGCSSKRNRRNYFRGWGARGGRVFFRWCGRPCRASNQLLHQGDQVFMVEWAGVVGARIE